MSERIRYSFLLLHGAGSTRRGPFARMTEAYMSRHAHSSSVKILPASQAASMRPRFTPPRLGSSLPGLDTPAPLSARRAIGSLLEYATTDPSRSAGGATMISRCLGMGLNANWLWNLGETWAGIARDFGAAPTGRMGRRCAAGALQPDLFEAGRGRWGTIRICLRAASYGQEHA
jgi:hypothetical protein